MNSLQSLSKKYYLLFNLPLHILFLVLLIFVGILDIKTFFIFFFLFYIIIYWLGIQSGTHKLFSHKSWEPRVSWIKYFLAIISCYGLMGGPISWSRIHRWHHRHSDTDNDPHSPKKGTLYSYYKWLLNPPDVPIFVIKDYLNDKKLIFIEKNCRSIVILSLIISFLINYSLGMAFLSAMIITFHCEMFVNAFMHKKQNDTFNPINNIFLAPIFGGSTLHKNHHDNPKSSNFSNYWYELDLSYYLIILLKK